MTVDLSKLPETVQRLPDNELVEPRSLKVGEQFVFGSITWTVKEVGKDGIDCVVDHARFQFGQ